MKIRLFAVSCTFALLTLAGCDSTPGAGGQCGDGNLDNGEECDTAGASATCTSDCKQIVPPDPGPPQYSCTVVDGSNDSAIKNMAANVLGTGATLQMLMANNNTPGVSIALRDQSGVVHTAVFGDANNSTYDPAAPPLSPSTLFQAASTGKSISALAYLLSNIANTLNSDIRPTVMSFVSPAYLITPTDILSHSAGTGPPSFATDYKDGDTLPTTAEYVTGPSPLGVTFDGSKKGQFVYSGGGYTLWQLWLEQTAQKSLDSFVRENLFTPAGATRSSFTQPLTSATEHDAACGKSQHLTTINACRNAYGERAAAGLWTTPTELACMTGYVTKLHPEVLQVVTSRNFPSFNNGTYPQKMGVGLFHRPANGKDETQGHFFEHSGNNQGFRTQMAFFSDGRAIVAMDNGNPNVGSISLVAVRGLCHELNWPCEGANLAPPP